MRRAGRADMFVAAAMMAGLLATVPAAGAYTQFTNGNVTEFVSWRDTSGNVINAHDGGVIFANGRYYWYGMSLGTSGATSVGVVMYSSTDLYNWTYERVILPVTTSGPLRAPMRMERPKIVYNAASNRYVMWFHYVGYPGSHTTDVGRADAGIASSTSVNGTYSFHGYIRPEGAAINVKDSTLFVDTDGTGYFVHASKESSFTMYVDKLTSDYRGVASFKKLTNVTQREAPALFKRNGYYFLFTSGVSGWNPNRAKYYRATNVMGPYTDMGDPCAAPNNETTYNSQSTYLYPVQGKSDAFILMTERHDPSNIGRSSFIWLPIQFPTASTLRVQYYTTWDLGYFGSSPTPTPLPVGAKREAESLTVTASSGDARAINSESGASGGQYVMYSSNAVGDFIRFRVPGVAAGTYGVTVGFKRYTPRATVQTVVGSEGGTLGNLGAPIDMYGGSAFLSANVGAWTVGTAGDQSVELRVTGHNASSTGYTMAIDYVTLTPQ